MHGLINTTLQCFMRDTYGDARWAKVLRALHLDAAGFEAMLSYEDELTARLVSAIAEELGRLPGTLLEDVGHYLVSHPRREALRRLLRFSGRSFRDFLHALDELPDRVRLAVPDLELPDIDLNAVDENRIVFAIRDKPPGASHVLLGLLRAMSDDYGALAILDLTKGRGDRDLLSISVAQDRFSAGRAFSLAGEARTG